MAEQSRITILTVDDHAVLREGIAAVLNHQPDLQVIAEAATAKEALAQFREHRPDVTLLDLILPDSNGTETLMTIRKEFPQARIIILSTLEGDFEIRRAFEAGASGYLLKTMPPPELFRAIREVHKGKKHIPGEVAASLAAHFSDEQLTKREIEVLTHLADGNRNRDIAETLFISEETVKAHVKNIMGKLGASDRTEAVAIGVRRGFIYL